MQASLDELARMRDLVSTGELPGPAASLLAQIRSLSAPARARRRGRSGANRLCGAGRRADRPGRRRSAACGRRAGAGARGAHAGAAPLAVPLAGGESVSSAAVRGFDFESRGEQRAGTAGTGEPAGGAGGDGARRCGPARHHAQQCRRGEHLPRASRPASQLHRLQPGRAGAHRHSAQGAAARSRNGDRSAGVEPPSGRRTRTATTSIRSSSTAIPPCSNSHGRSPRPRATSRAFKGCSRR